jgi:hypothetical protein
MIIVSIVVAALIVAGVLWYRTFGCEGGRKRFMDRARGHERARLRSEIVDRNRAAHIKEFEAEHGSVDPELVARYGKALDR